MIEHKKIVAKEIIFIRDDGARDGALARYLVYDGA
jgi:hypothetical protein